MNNIMENEIDEMRKKLITILKDRNETVSTMESCTGGLLASEITNNEAGSSEVFRFGLVTYSNEFKIKNGINSKTIQTYSVYSKEVATEMAKSISNIANSNWGIGITGQIGRIDPENPGAKSNTAYYCIFSKNVCNTYEIHCEDNLTKKQKKELLVFEIIKSFLNILEEDKQV